MNIADVLNLIGWAITISGTVARWVGFVTGSAEMTRMSWPLWAVGCWLGAVSFAMLPDPVDAVIVGTLAAICTYMWWRNRRKGRGKKALKELGAKSRARVEALVRRVREMGPSPIPAPVGGRS